MRTVHFSRLLGKTIPVVVDGPEPGSVTGSHLLVKVAASSINGSDLGLRRGDRVMRILSSGGRILPGFDIAGEVIACGPAVTAFAPGDRVMALLGHRGGGQSDYVSVPQHRAALIPDSLPDIAAAALPLAGLTALQALRQCGHLQPGIKADETQRKVLIIGAAGGIGSYAVQLAKVFGAHVTAVTSGNRKGYLRDLGADAVVDRHESDIFNDNTSNSNSNDVYDVVLDVPGIFRFEQVRSALSGRGVLVSTRPISSDTFRLLHRSAALRTAPRFAAVTTSASNQDLGFLLRLVHEGRLMIPIDQTFTLDHIVDAYERAESGDLRGKVVVTL